jgi:hypothetical protein
MWFFDIYRGIADPLGSGAFLFISGASAILSYRGRTKKAEISKSYSRKTLRNEYFLRAFFILMISLLYNTFVAIMFNDLSLIWNWTILLTISFSLIMIWPLFKTSKLFRICFGMSLLFLNQLLLSFLLGYVGQNNLFGVMYYALYNNLELDPILSFFTFFVIGTVIGDVLYDLYKDDNKMVKREVFKRNFLIPSLILGVILIVFGVIFQFPNFLHHRTFSWFFYSLGIELIIFAFLMGIEEIGMLNTQKRYRFLSYFSYYSFTVYLLHNLLYFLFLHSLYPFNIWIYISAIIFIMGFALRSIYNKWGSNFSIKLQIGRLSLGIAKLIDNRKKFN